MYVYLSMSRPQIFPGSWWECHVVAPCNYLLHMTVQSEQLLKFYVAMVIYQAANQQGFY